MSKIAQTFTPEQLAVMVIESIRQLCESDDVVVEQTLDVAVAALIESIDDDDDSDDGLTPAERRLAKMGTKLSKAQRTVLQQAEERAARKALKKAKNEPDADDADDSKKKVSETADLITKLRSLAGVTTKLVVESVTGDNVFVVYDRDVVVGVAESVEAAQTQWANSGYRIKGFTLTK